MKIVVASSGLGHVARGIEAWAADLGRALATRGMDVTVCKGGGRPEVPHERVIDCWQRGADRTGQLLRWLPKRLTWRLGLASGYGVEQTTFALRLIDYLRREDVDLLHVQDPQVALIVQRAQSLGLLRTRTILAHGTEEPPSFLRKINYLQHLAPWHLDEARKVGAWRETWCAIPNFIDTQRFRPGRADRLRAELNIPADALVLLSVAAIKRRHKRIDYLVEEFRRLRQQAPALPAWLIVAGGWEAGTDELVAAGQQALGDRVRFLVRFPRERMPELYRAADAFTLCSLKEMMPIALLEAAASGLPCVVNRHPVMEWMIGPGGQAIDMATSGALAGAVEVLFADKPRRDATAAAGRAHCQRNFSVERVVGDICDYYRAVLELSDLRRAA
jgi:glycosyltransferase involved in cell wall biosynthesis